MNENENSDDTIVEYTDASGQLVRKRFGDCTYEEVALAIRQKAERIELRLLMIEQAKKELRRLEPE